MKKTVSGRGGQGGNGGCVCCGGGRCTLSADIMEGNLCGKDRQSNCQAWALKRNKEEQWRRLQWRSRVTEAACTHRWRWRQRQSRDAWAPCKPHWKHVRWINGCTPVQRPQPPPQALSAQRGNLHGLFQSAIMFLLLFLKVSFHFLKEENIVENWSVGCLDEKKKNLAADTEAEGQTKTSASTAARITSLLTSLQSHAASFVNVSCLEWNKINLILPSSGWSLT